MQLWRPKLAELPSLPDRLAEGVLGTVVSLAGRMTLHYGLREGLRPRFDKVRSN